MKQAEPEVAKLAHNKYYGVGGFTAVKAFFANYVNFTGRSTRREYWWFTLFMAIFGVIAGIASLVYIGVAVANHLDDFTAGMSSGNFFKIIAGMLGLVIAWVAFYLAIILPSLALAVRRFRDAGVHWGFYVLLTLVNLVWSVMYINNTKMLYIVTLPVAIIMFVIEVLPSKNPPVVEHQDY